MRVLIVEDSDAIAKMIEALVTPRGFAVKSEPTGPRGLSEAFAWKPDVVLLDVHIPGPFDGIELLTKLKAAPETKDMPVIVISGANDDETRRRAHEAGAMAFYSKPFSPLALLKEMETLLRRAGEP